VRALVVGVGSSILTDDGVGVHAVRRLVEEGLPEGIDAVEIGTGGLALLDLVRGYERLVLLDAIVTGAPPGTVHVLTGDDVALTAHLGMSHEADLPTVLALSRELLEETVPADVAVVAIEAKDVTTFSESLSPEVSAALPRAIEEVRRRLREGPRSTSDPSP
jgi:hydrogenase maturation protease